MFVFKYSLNLNIYGKKNRFSFKWLIFPNTKLFIGKFTFFQISPNCDIVNQNVSALIKKSLNIFIFRDGDGVIEQLPELERMIPYYLSITTCLFFCGLISYLPCLFFNFIGEKTFEKLRSSKVFRIINYLQLHKGNNLIINIIPKCFIYM